MTKSLTVHQLLEEKARLHPSRTALVDDHRRLDYSGWWRCSLSLASLLQENGVSKGDLVGVLTTKSVFLPCSFVAVSLLGARFVALNPGWPPQEKTRVFEDRPERFLLAEEGFEHRGWSSERRLVSSPESLLEEARTPDEIPETGADEIVYLNVTSASTGLAKVAETSQRQLLANTEGVCSSMGLSEPDVHMSLFGVIGHPHEIFMRGLFLGGKTVLTDLRYPRELLQLIGDEQVTCLMGLPPQLESLARLTARGDVDVSSLRIAEAGGMYISQDFIDKFEQRAGIGLYSVWGSTETSGVVLLGDPGHSGFTRIVDGYEIELRDSDGSVIESEGRGEMWVSGTGVVDRYRGDRAATEEAFSDGWYRTGDIFRRDAEGRLIFLGRRGGLIKAAGLKVYPLELELAILRHPQIADACVVGANHPVRGEIATAYIVPKPGADLSAAEMRRFLSPQLEEHKVPRIFSFVPGLPRTANGKIDRKAIGKTEIEPDYRGEILRTDVELVRLLNHRAQIISSLALGFDPTWVEEQVSNVVGHNPGPLSDSALREIFRFIISTFEKR